ncbi:unnamed protein product, partial [Chrysoparadoxa australica]
AISKGNQQVADSLAHLDKKKSFGIDAVTAVRVAADDRETQRRMDEEQGRQGRLQRLQREAVRSGKQNAAVEMRWSELMEQNMPQELHHEIVEQKAACQEIIHSKEELIQDFQQQLKSKDEEYIKSLKQQADDIEELLERMRVEFRELREEYEVELEAIEETFFQERSELLTANKGEIDALFEKRRELELSYMEQKQTRQDECQHEIETLQNKDADEYNKLKVKLEMDIQTLEQQLEEMRATYQLNTEKLEYNYRVLTERDMENSATLAHQKRKLTKLKDALSALVQRYQETDLRDKRKNVELADDYRRITRQYKDLQAKFRHFEEADNSRYDAVWAMHQEEVQQLIPQVLTADRILHEQLLGWDWSGPNMDMLTARVSRDFDAAVTAPTVVSEVAAVEEEDSEGNQKVSGVRIKAVLTLLAQEAGFLVDSGVKAAIDSLPPDQARLASATSMLQNLGVTKEEDLAAMLSYFFGSAPDNREEGEQVPAADFVALGLDPESGPEALQVLLTIIQPDDVISAIQSFVDDRKEAQLLKQARSKNLTLDDGGGGGEGKTRQQREKIIRQKEKEHWDRLSRVVSDQNWEVWQQLEKALARYNELLHERSRRIERVKAQQDENVELKKLLRTYLGSEVNQDLLVPPSSTINFGAPTSSFDEGLTTASRLS